jgi:diguanylate cyclase (GGDEF)-like protein/PAS domain S-box-containing protein
VNLASNQQQIFRSRYWLTATALPAVAGGLVTAVVFLMTGSIPAALLSGLPVLVAMLVALRHGREQLRLANEQLFLMKQIVVNYPNGVILLYDEDVRFHFLEGQGISDLGFSHEFVIGRTMGEIFPPDVWEPIRHYYEDVFKGHSATFELRFRDLVRQGHTMPVRDQQGNIVAGMVVTYDITRQKIVEQSLREQEERLMRLALHDPLTNLANRTLFNNQLEQALARGKRNGSGVAVLFLDLDNFKLVNDTLGHEAGDQLLIRVAERLRTTVRAGDTVARFGGDEFVLLLENVTNDHDVATAADHIRKAVHAPCLIDGQTISTSASIGYSICLSDEYIEAGELIRRADLAMYRAKSSGKNRVVSLDVYNDRQLALTLD